MGERKFELLLAAVIAARATSFIFSKLVLESMGTFNLMALRFLLAFAVLILVFMKRLRRLDRQELTAGICVGALFFLVMACELTALKTTASGTVSMLENCSIIFVPFFEAIILRRFPEKSALISALTALAGVFCLTFGSGAFSGGMAFALLAAALYAAAIIVTANVSHHTHDSLCIGIVQVGTIGLLALAASFIFETPHLPQSGAHWVMIAGLAVVCTGFGFTLQPVAQGHVSAERAGLFCAISPAVASILGAVVLKERLGVLGLLGLGLILLSIALPYLHFKKRAKTEKTAD